MMLKDASLLHLKSFLASPIKYMATRWRFSQRLGVKRWASAASLQDDWDARTALMASLVSPGMAVLEFGAGKEHLRLCLPRDCEYQPCDIVARSPATLVCDLNHAFPTLDKKWDVILFSGVLEYIHDVPHVLSKVRAHGDSCILSYAVTDHLECMTTRMRSGWVNHFSSAAIETMIRDAQFVIHETRTWNGQRIYSLR